MLLSHPSAHSHLCVLFRNVPFPRCALYFPSSLRVTRWRWCSALPSLPLPPSRGAKVVACHQGQYIVLRERHLWTRLAGWNWKITSFSLRGRYAALDGIFAEGKYLVSQPTFLCICRRGRGVAHMSSAMGREREVIEFLILIFALLLFRRTTGDPIWLRSSLIASLPPLSAQIRVRLLARTPFGDD